MQQQTGGLGEVDLGLMVLSALSESRAQCPVAAKLSSELIGASPMTAYRNGGEQFVSTHNEPLSR